MPLITGIYRHYKGSHYRVLGIARHSETMEELVVYRALYDDHGLWVRPVTMFTETVEVNGEPVARFALEQADPGHTDDPSDPRNIRNPPP